MSADIVAADQLKAIVQRVERLEAEIADLNADKSEIYKEARANGFDVKVIKKVVSKRKIDEHERVEQDHVFDLYWDAVHGTNLVHARVRENIEEFDAETGEILDGAANANLIATVATGMQTEIGRKALVTALDIMIEREEAEERRSDAGLNIVTKHTEITASPETANASLANGPCEAVSERTATQVDASASAEAGVSGQPEMIPATSAESAGEVAGSASDLPTNSEKATVATQGEATAPTSDERVSLPVDDRSDAAANAGGDHVDGNALRVPTSVTGEGAASALPAKSKLRPHCQRPGNTCGGYGDKHCHDCLRAMREYEAA